MKLVDCHERYFAFPCFSGRSKRKVFTDIVDRVWNRIKGWGEKLLSIGGKEILIEAVIQAILSYAISIFRLPKSLFEEIQRLMARFWWGGNEKIKKLHWCKWQWMCKPKANGGSGFRDLETFNRALLAKQSWRIFKNPNSLAARVLKGCYFNNSNFLDISSYKKGSFVWNSFMWGRAILDKGMQWKVGNGKTIFVYKDNWLPRKNVSFITSQPLLDQNCMVYQLLTPSGVWDTQWSRNYVDDLHIVNHRSIHTTKKEDVDRWRPSDQGKLKINCGATIDSNKRLTGVGSIIRDDYRRVMARSSHRCDVNFDYTTVKALAILKGLEFSRDCGLKVDVVETDSKEDFKKVNFKFVSKMANRVAWNLANEAIVAWNLAKEAMVSVEDGFWMDDTPFCITHMVLDEC
ncbi:hypothetical protein Ddye_001754 [Dipteronia dyeriana]|uniref:RNase H type-1 domain-containing protein n=1 Tax=Dipteronia dyeriana TaxID=168575 RepID=A0AAD9XPH5_9ROSI|nr:hypothetical protein Ddye_001754 [Dipteronia dyeriana]